MIKTSFIPRVALALCIVFCSCNNNSKNDDGNQINDSLAALKDTTPAGDMAVYHFTYITGNLMSTSPIEMLDEFAKSNLPADVGLLNPAENVDNYHTSMKQAFNYGIYGVDLGYLVVNNRTLDVIKYYSTAKKLAEQLNMSETFNRFVDRFEGNKENKDTLSRVIDEAYGATDEYLRTNERLETASEVLAGSWIECQYITVNLLKNAERNSTTETLFQRVWEQRLYLDNISKLLGEFKNADLTPIKKDFESLLAIYKEPVDANAINKDFLNKLSEKLKAVREGIIK